MKDEILPISPVDLYGNRGVFIVNEGNYLYGNGSLSYYSIDSKEVINNIYSLANGVPLGDVAYSMTIYKGKGYVAVNNSSSIQVFDANTLLHQGTITDLPSPRHILFLNDEKALVSDLYARGISVINPTTMAVVGKINTGGPAMPFYQHGTENLIKIGSEVFTNCWSFDNKVLVISTESLAVIDSIEVGIQPLAMVKDKNNFLWVVCDGGYAGNPVGHERPSIIRINTSTHEVELKLNFPSLNDIVGQIATTPAGDSLYFISNNIYKMHIDDSELPQEPIIYKNNRNFRALGVDPITGEIYVSDAIDYLSEGKVYRYSSCGVAIDTIDVGIIPGNFCFN
jgi:hypothetical protein